MTTGFGSRGATFGDLEVLTALVRIADQSDAGEPSVTGEDIRSGWNLPEFDLQDDVLPIFGVGTACDSSGHRPLRSLPFADPMRPIRRVPEYHSEQTGTRLG